MMTWEYEKSYESDIAAECVQWSSDNGVHVNLLRAPEKKKKMALDDEGEEDCSRADASLFTSH